MTPKTHSKELMSFFSQNSFNLREKTLTEFKNSKRKKLIKSIHRR
jgi:hypothetical protein